MKSATGLTSARNGAGALPDPGQPGRTERHRDGGQETPQQGEQAVPHHPRSRLLMPSATAMIALYSGPTTIAATIRTWSS